METLRRVDRWGRGVRIAIITGAAFLAIGSVAMWSRTTGTSDKGHRVVVDRFRSNSASANWSGKALAESVVTRLATVPGLSVRLAGGRFAERPEFTVGGDIDVREGRLVITARLFRAREHDALWSARFWRQDSLSSELVGDVSAAVAEAINGHLAPRK